MKDGFGEWVDEGRVTGDNCIETFRRRVPGGWQVVTTAWSGAM